MHFSTLSSVFLLASSAVSFTIPKDHSNGVYMVSYQDGNELHTLIADAGPSAITSRDTVQSAKFIKRQLPSGGTNVPHCNYIPLVHADTDAANSALDKQCGTGATVGIGLDYYSIVGCTVAYFCNLSTTGSDTYKASERQAVSQELTADCGGYTSAWNTFTSPAGRNNMYGPEQYVWASGLLPVGGSQLLWLWD